MIIIVFIFSYRNRLGKQMTGNIILDDSFIDFLIHII